MEILVGTTKGLFVLEDGRVEGPFCEGWPINHAVGRGGEIFAAGGSGWHGAGVWRRVGGEWAVSKGPERVSVMTPTMLATASAAAAVTLITGARAAAAAPRRQSPTVSCAHSILGTSR